MPYGFVSGYCRYSERKHVEGAAATLVVPFSWLCYRLWCFPPSSPWEAVKGIRKNTGNTTGNVLHHTNCAWRPASAKPENLTAAVSVLAPGGFATVDHSLSCFTYGIFQLANEDATITNQPQALKTLRVLLGFLDRTGSPDVDSKCQYIHGNFLVFQG